RTALPLCPQTISETIVFVESFQASVERLRARVLGAVLYQIAAGSAWSAFKSTDENDWLLDPADEDAEAAGLAGKCGDRPPPMMAARRPNRVRLGHLRLWLELLPEMPASLPDRHELVHAGVLRSLIGEDQSSPPHRFAPSLNVCRKRDFDRYLESLCPHQAYEAASGWQRLMSDRLCTPELCQVGRAGSEELLTSRHLWRTVAHRQQHSAPGAHHQDSRIRGATVETGEYRTAETSANACSEIGRSKTKALVVMRDGAKATETLLDERKQQLMNLDRADAHTWFRWLTVISRCWTHSSHQRLVQNLGKQPEADSHEAAHELWAKFATSSTSSANWPTPSPTSPGAEGLDDSELESELDKLAFRRSGTGQTCCSRQFLTKRRTGSGRRRIWMPNFLNSTLTQPWQLPRTCPTCRCRSSANLSVSKSAWLS
uniref:DUF4110 domain-containing protein n=1 Tax=Macrostomum lignano TaxID=282301 RepID=A0A1I8JP37_9PLAT